MESNLCSKMVVLMVSNLFAKMDMVTEMYNMHDSIPNISSGWGGVSWGGVEQGWSSRNQHVQKGQKKKMSHTNYVNAAYGMEDNTKNPIYRPNGRYVPRWTPLIQISSDVACTFTSLYMLFVSISFLKTILNCCALNIACTCSCTS